MHSVIAFSVFGVDWVFLKPYIVLGLALGGAYALSGVGLVVLYRATGTLNIAFGAVGAAGALITYYMINHTGLPHWLAYLACVLFGCDAVRQGRRPVHLFRGDLHHAFFGQQRSNAALRLQSDPVQARPCRPQARLTYKT